MIVIRDIVYLTPRQWHAIRPEVADQDVAANLWHYQKGPWDQDVNLPYGGLSKESIRDITAIHERLFGKSETS